MSYFDDFRHLDIPLEDVKAATNNFNDKPIGTGGFGTVYKGELLLPTGRRVVAFKRLDRKFGQGDAEFWKEIMMLSQLKHQNLASLLHFCREGGERILVYEYVSRQSLDGYLNNASVTWIQRLHICIGAAKGVNYLHDPKKTHRVVHRDIKSSNILLDDKWTAKVSDFGLSKSTPANQSRSYLVSNVAGTLGYCDPAYHETGFLSKECDVYSFGVVLFEVMCGRLCCEYDKDNKLKRIFVHTWKKRYHEKRLDEIVFPDLRQIINQESLSTFAAIATRCLDRDPKERPNMTEVIKELEIAFHHQENSKQNKASVAKITTPHGGYIEPLQKSKQNKAIVAKTTTPYVGFLKDFDHLKIELEDIQQATNKFSEDKVIGVDGFGKVYRGDLSVPGGQSMVCFKRYDRRFGQGNTEFWKEIMFLSKYKHENLVSLLKFCNEGDEMILVHNYASRGSLDRYLNDPSVTWTQRLKICVGVACAMNYLHDPVGDMRVLHRDLKSSNILLDEDWTAKVSNVGLAKLGPANQTYTFLVSNPVGTIGYCDPVYMETGILTKASDVYSFGVVLLEILCGRLAITKEVDRLVPKWRRCYYEKRLDEIIFSDTKEQMSSFSLNAYSSIAYKCLKRDREERPTMAEVMKELKTALEQQEDFEETQRIQNLVTSPITNTSQNQNFMRFPNGVLVGDGNTWLAILKGKVCEVISATKCISADSLVHDDTQNSRFSNVIKGGMYNGFTIKVTTQFLSPKAAYSVSLVFKQSDTDHGTHIPFKFKLEGERYYSNSCMTHVRDGGWLMTELCQFTSHKREHVLGIHFLPLFDITSSRIKYLFEGIEFCPVRYAS
ncbi:receptor like protein kinase S.2-like [Bidens hawaiensis]|uniref:receptor like protein kinase S.2-like n=1 Tax=Bidens hawaiensis TaxID=980011 RepID=UPI0040490B75